MRTCDLCKDKIVALEREIPFAEFRLDMCEHHYEQFQEAIRLATSIFRSTTLPPELEKLFTRLRATERPEE